MQQPMIQIPALGGLNFDEAPFLAIWEVTQSCDLACKHCRAAAQPIPHPDQLTTEEGKALIDQIAEMKIPIFVFTGGDPMKRPDVYELIRYSAEKGVKVAVTPSATPLLTREAIFKMKEAGVVRLGISLDGSCPEIHDKFRGLPGAFARTIQAVQWANEAGLPIQVHSTISRHNAHDLDNLCNLFEKLAIVMWNVFFLVPLGRGQLADLLSGEEFEQVFGKIYELSRRVSFQIKTTEAMHYRRYLLQHNLEERKMAHGPGHPGSPLKGDSALKRHDIGRTDHVALNGHSALKGHDVSSADDVAVNGHSALKGHDSSSGDDVASNGQSSLKGHDFSRADDIANKNVGALAPAIAAHRVPTDRSASAALAYEPGAPIADPRIRAQTWATRRVNDGKGFMFISHTGNVYPSGFLPIHAGNIRETALADIYRHAPIFKSLRDTSQLEGKCGACEYKEICGGSRARAYAMTGDPLAEEPCCIYQPRNWQPREKVEPVARFQLECSPSLVTL